MYFNNMKFFHTLRADQWLKNIVLFAALIFSGTFRNPEVTAQAALGFIVFCLLSSAIYLFNDICDKEQDKHHPTKKDRPIASGDVSLSTGAIYALILALLGITLSFLFFSKTFTFCAIAFLGLNILYSLIFKKVVILDVMAISLSFVIRAIAGGFAIQVHISPWLVLCTLLLATFLGLSKRRHEIFLLDDAGVEHRPLLKDYSLYFLDQMIAVVTTSTLIVYILYTLLGEIKTHHGVAHMEWTIPFVMYGIFRYLFLVHRKHQGGSPTRTFFSDLPLIINVLFWAALSIILIIRQT
jgi:4-hydroxybenzoate polyprenyltransferase